MNYTRMIKGASTELTYKVIMSYLYLTWDIEVYEPFKQRRLWGLLPEKLAYRYVYSYDSDDAYDVTRYNKNLTPKQVQKYAENAVRSYEEHKLAWEVHKE